MVLKTLEFQYDNASLQFYPHNYLHTKSSTYLPNENHRKMKKFIKILRLFSQVFRAIIFTKLLPYLNNIRFNFHFVYFSLLSAHKLRICIATFNQAFDFPFSVGFVHELRRFKMDFSEFYALKVLYCRLNDQLY